MQAFAQFGSDLDAATKAVLDHGQKVRSVLVQPQYQSRSVEQQVISLFALKYGFTRKIPVSNTVDFINKLQEEIVARHPEYLEEIQTQKIISKERETNLKETMSAFVESYFKTIEQVG